MPQASGFVCLSRWACGRSAVALLRCPLCRLGFCTWQSVHRYRSPLCLLSLGYDDDTRLSLLLSMALRLRSGWTRLWSWVVFGTHMRAPLMWSVMFGVQFWQAVRNLVAVEAWWPMGSRFGRTWQGTGAWFGRTTQKYVSQDQNRISLPTRMYWDALTTFKHPFFAQSL